jgi:hypothetical protein
MSNTTATKPAATPVLTWGFGEETDDAESHFEWDYLVDSLTELMQKINKGGKWFATVENFGWQAKSGYLTFEATKGDRLLSRILPNTENHFKIFVEGKGFGRHFRIQNFHHDSPVGNEWYTVRRWNADRDPAS